MRISNEAINNFIKDNNKSLSAKDIGELADNVHKNLNFIKNSKIYPLIFNTIKVPNKYYYDKYAIKYLAEFCEALNITTKDGHLYNESLIKYEIHSRLIDRLENMYNKIYKKWSNTLFVRTKGKSIVSNYKKIGIKLNVNQVRKNINNLYRLIFKDCHNVILGQVGEDIVYHKIKTQSPNTEIAEDINIKDPSRKSKNNQIDVLAFNKHGIFAFEVKTLTGQFIFVNNKGDLEECFLNNKYNHIKGIPRHRDEMKEFKYDKITKKPIYKYSKPIFINNILRQTTGHKNAITDAFKDVNTKNLNEYSVGDNGVCRSPMIWIKGTNCHIDKRNKPKDVTILFADRAPGYMSNNFCNKPVKSVKLSNDDIKKAYHLLVKSYKSDRYNSGKYKGVPFYHYSISKNYGYCTLYDTIKNYFLNKHFSNILDIYKEQKLINRNIQNSVLIYYHNNKNMAIRINKTYNGYTFKKNDLSKLSAGKFIVIDSVSENGNPYKTAFYIGQNSNRKLTLFYIILRNNDDIANCIDTHKSLTLSKFDVNVHHTYEKKRSLYITRFNRLNKKLKSLKNEIYSKNNSLNTNFDKYIYRINTMKKSKNNIIHTKENIIEKLNKNLSNYKNNTESFNHKLSYFKNALNRDDNIIHDKNNTIKQQNKNSTSIPAYNNRERYRDILTKSENYSYLKHKLHIRNIIIVILIIVVIIMNYI